MKLLSTIVLKLLIILILCICLLCMNYKPRGTLVYCSLNGAMPQTHKLKQEWHLYNSFEAIKDLHFAYSPNLHKLKSYNFGSCSLDAALPQTYKVKLEWHLYEQQFWRYSTFKFFNAPYQHNLKFYNYTVHYSGKCHKGIYAH